MAYVINNGLTNPAAPDVASRKNTVSRRMSPPDRSMDDDVIAELRRQVREQTERADEAARDAERERQRAEDERQRAETERLRAEAAGQREEAERQRAEDERLRADQAENQSRPTTLAEYIGNCHRLLDLNVAVESDKSLTSKGPTTSPQNKCLPSRLTAWPDFLETQRAVLGRLHSTYPADERAFESLSFLQGLGERLASRKVANERDLEHVQHSIVEDPVSNIVNALRGNAAATRRFDLANGVVFDNHPNALSDGAEEPMRRRAAYDPNQLRPDQVCVYRHDDTDPARRTLAFVIEYKPPHKLTLPHLRLGLREMDIQEEVVNRATVPTDPTGLFQYHADKIVATAVTQVYHYMITGGLEYSYLTTGEAYVFFRLDWADPGHLLFHLAEPRVEVEAHPDNSTHCTAVSQVLAFTLLALTSRPRGQDERHQAMERLDKWAEDLEAILRRIPATERKQTPPSSAFVPRTYSEVDRSPYILRPRDPAPSCRPISWYPASDESPEHSDDDDTGPHQESPSIRHSLRARRQAQSNSVDHRHPAPDSAQLRQYCTQRCLLGLVTGGLLDEACPNVLLHRKRHLGLLHHPLDPASWLLSLRRQLLRSLDADVIPLWKQGARGVAFQVTLAAYGYSVIAKCTVPEFVEDLAHEASIYETIKSLQGLGVPVFLGALHLERPYYYDHRVRLVHMMLLSSAGSPVSTRGYCLLRTPKFEHDLEELLKAIHQLGVIHGDVRDPNIFWCSETKRPMLIDFERATLESLRPPITKVRSPKRIRSQPRGHRRSKSTGDNCQLQPIVLNGRVRRPFDKLCGKSKRLAHHGGSRSLGNAATVAPSSQEVAEPVENGTGILKLSRNHAP